MSLPRLDLITAADLPLPFGRYELQSILGEGGMAIVFSAELLGPAGFRKRVAIKIIKPDALEEAEESDVELLAQEARLGGLLRHPNLVDVYELGEEDGQLFISMEWIHGLTLGQLLSRGQRLPPAIILEIGAGIAAGLSSIHALATGEKRQGIVHRDLKPSNVLLSWDGAVKVVDFGVAITQQRSVDTAADEEEEVRVQGTPSYMSPEQLMGEGLDGRSDLYALGLVLTEATTGRRLPRNFLMRQILQGKSPYVQILGEEELLTADQVIPGLRPLLQRCTQPHPKDRYQSADQLLADIDSLREQVGSRPRLRSWLRRSEEEPAGAEEEAPSSSPASAQVSTKVQQPGQPEPTRTRPQRPRTNLTPSLDPFVGRARPLSQLHELLTASTSLITLKGTGGSGKTRLARRLAWDQAEILPGGAWFVDLTEARSALGIVHATASALGLSLPGAELEDQVTRLGEALEGRSQLLLVMDNFEQVVEHAAQTLQPWRELAPEAHFLVTSREPLRLPGETVVALGPLTEADAVELFRLRASAAGGGRSLESASEETLLELVRRLDCLPLALELAAARTALLPPRQLLTRLHQRFQLLQGGRRGDSERQRTLRALIDWSWELLEPWEQSAFLQLSVCHDGFTIETAESILDLSRWADAPWSLDVVSSLLDKSLLHSWPSEGQPRFGMYLSLQDYARQRLQQGAVEGVTLSSARQRHARHFATFGEEGFLERIDQHEGQSHLRVLQLELENLLAGMEHSLSCGEDETAGLCALAAGAIFTKRGPFTEGVKVLKRTLPLTLSERLKILIHISLGDLLRFATQPERAQEHQERALELAQLGGYDDLAGRILGRLGNLARRQGDQQEALRLTEEGLALLRAEGCRVVEGQLLVQQGLIENSLGKVELSCELLQEALSIQREVGDLHTEGITLSNLAIVYSHQGAPEEAQRCFEEALRLHRSIGDRSFEGKTLVNLAVMHLHNECFDEAETQLHEALKVLNLTGDRLFKGVVEGNLGNIHIHRKQYLQAEPRLRRAITLCEKAWVIGGASLRSCLALVCAHRGKREEAEQLFEQAAPVLRGGNLMEYGSFLCKRSEASALWGKPEEAERDLEEARGIATKLSGQEDSPLWRGIRNTHERNEALAAER